MPFNRDDEDDDLFDAVSAMADRMGLQGKERAAYIDDHMTQGGYGRVQSRESYARLKRDEEEGEATDSSRWGFGRGGGGGGRDRGRSGASSRDNGDAF
jgi:hypothetical protein